MKILYIANYVPPINGSATIRTLYYLNHLVDMGHIVDLLTIDYPEDFIRYDAGLEERIDKRVNYHKVSPGKMYLKIYPRKGSGGVVSTKKSLMSNIKGMVKTNLIIPDSYIGWTFHAYKKGLDLIAKNQYDLMFSMHESPSCHLLAYRLKKQHPELPWVGYWSDPWSNDPGRTKQPAWRKRVEFQLEKRVTKAMDKYLFTTEETREMYIQRFNLERAKTDIVYRGFDRQIYTEIGQKPNPLPAGKINFIYTGDIYTSLRDLNPLIQALEQLKKNREDVYEKINIQLVGFIDNPEMKQLLQTYQCVTLKDRVSYVESLAYMVHGDVLLLWGNKNSNQIPGKVYEYLGTENIVLTILGDTTDPLARLMPELERGPVIANTSTELFQTFVDVTERVGHKQVPASWTQVVEKFEWKNVVIDLVKKLQL